MPAKCAGRLEIFLADQGTDDDEASRAQEEDRSTQQGAGAKVSGLDPVATWETKNVHSAVTEPHQQMDQGRLIARPIVHEQANQLPLVEGQEKGMDSGQNLGS